MAVSSESQKDNTFEDCVSQLPNEVLLDILSLLTLKEAGRTSLLGKRWRDLWKLTGHLNFDASKVQSYLNGTSSDKMRRNTRELERSKFLKWVNQVLRAHEGPSIHEFRLKFGLDDSCRNDIDEWIRFMIQKRAKIVEIDIFGFFTGDPYTPSRDLCNFIKSASNISSVACLRSLCLGRVNVDGELVEYFLSTCPHLEMLSVSYSDLLVSLKVVGTSLSLKYLKIKMCQSLESIELCAPKLVSFFYFGRKVKYVVGSNPLLVELNIGGGYRQEVTHALIPFSCHLKQLERFTVDMMLEDCDFVLPQFEELSNLKHLILKLHLLRDLSVMQFTRFIEAAPSLVKFTLMLGCSRPVEHRIFEPPIQPHVSLKEVEILGFAGGVCDMELARYLLKNAINLEKLVMDPFHEKLLDCRGIANRLIKLRKDAEMLKKILPPGAELVVTL